MTTEEKLDRLERWARLLCEKPPHLRRKSQKQTAALGDYVTALREHDIAREALAAKPDDSETQENLRKAVEALDRTREELKRSRATQPRRPLAQNRFQS